MWFFSFAAICGNCSATCSTARASPMIMSSTGTCSRCWKINQRSHLDPNFHRKKINQKSHFYPNFHRKIIRRSHFYPNFHSLEGVAARRQKQTRDMPENRKCDSTCLKTWEKVTLKCFFSNCYSESSDLEANLYSRWNRWKPWFAVGKLGIW